MSNRYRSFHFHARAATVMVCLAVLLGLCGGVRGDYTTEWIGGTGGWDVEGNWDPVIPTDEYDAFINNGGVAEISAAAEANFVYVGYINDPGATGDGSGAIEQSSGVFNVDGSLEIAYGENTSGTYNLIGGTLNTEGGGVMVGRMGAGVFTQTGGVHTISGGDGHFRIGGGSVNSDGLYTLENNGELYSGDVVIGGDGNAAFVQNGADTVHVIGQSLYLGNIAANTNELTYTLTDGELWFKPNTASPWDSSIEACVGYFGVGTFIQEGGSVNYEARDGTAANFAMILGRWEDADGTYELQDGDMACTHLRVGDNGVGQFTQTGGTNTVAESVSIGHDYDGEGEYSLQTGFLYANSMCVGDHGVGRFEQTGGGNDIDWDLVLGSYGDSVPPIILGAGASGVLTTGVVQAEGTYILTDGSLSCDTQIIGDDGIGVFEQDLGSNQVSGTLTLAMGSGSWGEYNLFGAGELRAAEEVIGDAGEAAFTQSDGTNTVDTLLVLAKEIDSFGQYELTSDAELSTGETIIGRYGHGEFTQSGYSIHHISGELYLGLFAAFIPGLTDESEGNYTLEDFASLSAVNEYVGYGGTGSFVQTGGDNTVDGMLCLGDQAGSTGAYHISGGLLEVVDLYVGLEGSGWFDIDGSAEIYVSGSLRLGPEGAFTAVPDAVIHMTGSAFENESAAPGDVAGLSNLTLVFEGGPNEDDPFEVAGAIDGGFTDNFALGSLVIGNDVIGVEGHVALVDHTDNGHWAYGDECLFVHAITIEAESTLDLNGLWLYVDGNVVDQLEFYIDEGILFDGTIEDLTVTYDQANDWTRVPEPAAMTLLGLGGLILLRRRSR